MCTQRAIWPHDVAIWHLRQAPYDTPVLRLLMTKPKPSIPRPVLRCGKLADAMIPQADQRRMTLKLESLADDLQGDVKKLTGYSPEYRLRVGTWRALFEIEGDKVVVYRILHRSKAYSS